MGTFRGEPDVGVDSLSNAVNDAEAYKNSASASASAASTSATNAATSETNAATSETNAAASEANTAADAISTAADAVSTAADAVSTAADAANTAADAISTAADVVSCATSETNASASAAIALNSNLYEAELTDLVHPDTSKGLQELQAAGDYPTSFNQQWGGMGYGGLPDGTMGEVSAQNMITNVVGGFAYDATSDYIFQPFSIGKNDTLESLYFKLGKTLNPTNNLLLYIYSDDGTGKPDALITNGTATAVSGKTITDYEYVLFTFPTPPSLSAGVKYHIVLNGSSLSTSNYYDAPYNNASNSPFKGGGSGTTAQSWTISADRCHAFVIKTTTQILSTGLPNFDGALHHYEGATLDQSGGFCKQIDFMNHKRGMIHFAGTGWDKDKTFYDAGIGTDNNRIVVRCNVTTGYAQVDLYEDDETKHTVTGTTDISTGNHIVSIGYRSEGDGADFLYLYVDGASEGTPLTSQTITLSPDFLRGHRTLGGGFPVAPTWTTDESMAALPSAGAYTFAGAATEANVCVVSGGRLHFNGAGAAATDDYYYTDTTTFVNATGGYIEWKGLTDQGHFDVRLQDGSKTVTIKVYDYYVEINDGSVIGYHQGTFTNDTVFGLSFIGSDFYLIENGKIIFDGSGLLDAASGSNTVAFGDLSTTSGDNFTGSIAYFKVYQGAHLPEYSTMQLSEHAYWTEDKSSLLPTIYNTGTIQSVKTLGGLSNNYIEKKKQIISVKGIIATPSTASPTPIKLEDLSTFCFGGDLSISTQTDLSGSAIASSIWLGIRLDGVVPDFSLMRWTTHISGYAIPAATINKTKTSSGLHYIESIYYIDSGTATANSINRNLTVEAE